MNVAKSSVPARMGQLSLLVVMIVVSVGGSQLSIGAEPKFTDRLDHWAFRFPPVPSVPTLRDNGWVRNPIDAFLLTKMDELKLRPSPEADRRTLIRRLSLDVTGLPPTPEEVAEFVSDPAPDAYERLVDRLLASPRYGERWARHWLDLVHFGESHGYDKDKARLTAWPYRDYVIKAFNEDKPYVRFVQEQLAGDVLWPENPEALIATGFIAAGPWDFVGHVELPITKTDGLIARYNDRDDMVMTTMSTFESLTVHCARCHDHKFDPITQREYYNLQAVFAGVDRANRPFDYDQKTFIQRRDLLAKKKALEERRKELDAVVAKITSPEISRVDERVTGLKEELAKLPGKGSESPSNGYHSAIEPKPDVEKWVQVDLVQPLPIKEVRLIPARPTDFPDSPGFGFPKRFRVEASDEDTFKERVVLVDHMDEDYPNPGETPFAISVNNVKARFVRVTATRLWERTSDFVFALAELQVISGTNNIAQWAVVSALDSIEAGRWGKSKLTDGYDSRKALAGEAENPEMVAKRKELKQQLEELAQERKRLVGELMDEKTRAEIAEVSAQFSLTTNQLGSLPKGLAVYAAAPDFEPSGSFVPPKGPRSVHLLKRGDVKSPIEPASPGTISFLPGLKGQFDLADPQNEGSRRIALAKWITDQKNLLTRRSIVNRVWQYHFGRGLVDTPNDFGHMGARPTHPELLDWLAYWFQANGESFKNLHRLILTSAAYRQASTDNADYARSDADNRYLWRMDRQRLDAESFRDTLLALNGKLDLRMSGPSIQQFFFKDDHSPVYDYTRFDVDDPGNYRRSIYRFIVRSVPDPFMECLDSADPSLLTPKRNMTLTALQALSSLNNPFVLRQTEHFAAHVESLCRDTRAQIRLTFELALLRKPDLREEQELTAHTQKYGLVNACRVIFNSNEFVFVD